MFQGIVLLYDKKHRQDFTLQWKLWKWSIRLLFQRISCITSSVHRSSLKSWFSGGDGMWVEETSNRSDPNECISCVPVMAIFKPILIPGHKSLCHFLLYLKQLFGDPIPQSKEKFDTWKRSQWKPVYLEKGQEELMIPYYIELACCRLLLLHVNHMREQYVLTLPDLSSSRLLPPFIYCFRAGIILSRQMGGTNCSLVQITKNKTSSRNEEVSVFPVIPNHFATYWLFNQWIYVPGLSSCREQGLGRRVFESGICLLAVIKPKYAKFQSSNCSR